MDSFNSDLRLLHQLLLKFKEVYIHANQHFHVTKQCQKISELHEPS